MSEQNTVEIIADLGERRSGVIEALEGLGACVTAERLAAADYLASARVAIERKAAGDFLQSLVDKRLFNQAIALKEQFERPILLIEGAEGENVFEALYNSRSMNPNAIRGALSFILLEYGIPVLFTNGYEDTAQLIYTMARQEQTSKKEPWLRPKRSQDSVGAWQRYVVESLPGIGQKHADALLEHFGSVEKIIAASKEKLMEVEGIGEKKATKIRDVLTTKYKGLENEAEIEANKMPDEDAK